MNKVILLGRLTKDFTIKYTQKGDMIANNTIAVNRRFQKDKTDFINISAFGKTAEFMQKYLGKGSKVAVAGELRVNVTESEEGRKYFTEVFVTEIDFADSGRRQEYEEDIGDMKFENDLDFSEFDPIEESGEAPF